MIVNKESERTSEETTMVSSDTPSGFSFATTKENLEIRVQING